MVHCGCMEVHYQWCIVGAWRGGALRVHCGCAVGGIENYVFHYMAAVCSTVESARLACFFTSNLVAFQQ